MPDWLTIDPQLQQFAADGVSPTAMSKRLGIPRQSVVDRLRKLGLKEPQQSKASQRQETPMRVDEAPVEVLPGQMNIEEADTPSTDAVSPIGDIGAEAEMTGPLSPAEVQTLEHYEQIIDQGIKTFVKVGHALAVIRDERLYRERHQTFEDYLRQRWDLSRPHAYRMIEAAVVVEHLSPIGDIVPVNESQARPLAGLDPEQQVAVWQEAVKTAPSGKVTAAHVKNTVKRLKQGTTEPKVHKPKMQQPEPTPPSRQRVQDGLFAVLQMVRDDNAWPLLGELALLLSSAAERLDADQQQRMEQALSPLWHLIDAHRADE